MHKTPAGRTGMHRWWSLVSSMEILGCLEPWVYGTLGFSEPWFYGTLGSSDSWVFGALVPLDLRNLRKFGILLSVPLDLRILSVPVSARYRWSLQIQGHQFGSLDLRILGTLGNSVSFGQCPWIVGFYQCLALPGTSGV